MKTAAAYSTEEKISIVKAHEEGGRTLKQVCDEYGISKSYLCYLLKNYRERGTDSIQTTRYHSSEFKLRIIKRYYEEGIPIAELSRESGVQYRMIKEWLERYSKKGYEGLTTQKRGRPKAAAEPTTAETRMKQLEMENEVLRSFLEEYERWDAKR
jgi:transposase-like protein